MSVKYTAKEIAKITGGTLSGGDAEVFGVSTDTRTVCENDLFIAIKGENFDGNDFVAEAEKKGASAAVSDREQDVKIPVIKVSDTREALLALAHDYREKFPVKVVGVTGSVGKTSTKDMIAAVLSKKLRTFKTDGNFNNDIGLSKMLFELSGDFEAAVLEMGMSARGEISVLSRTACPQCCVITNIGFCHIENLKTQENILRAKLEILDGADKNAPLIVCGDDEFLRELSAEKLGRRVVKYGFSENCDVRAVDVTHLENGEEFTLVFGENRFRASIPAAGEHMILNALAAFCTGVEFGLSPEEIISGFADYTPSGMRQKIEKRGGLTLILDCYNASPTSMKSSLSVLKNRPERGRKIAVLGDMLELGERSHDLHAGLVELSDCADLFFLYGQEMRALRDEFSRREIPVFHSESKQEITEMLLENVRDGDVILFKGSRGMKMEEIAQRIGV